MKDDKYDEAVEVSQSMDQSHSIAQAPAKARTHQAPATKKSSAPPQEEAKGLTKNAEMSKSQSITNNHFDEALEFSRSGSDQSVDTVGSSPGHHRNKPAATVAAAATAQIPQMSAAQRSAAAQLNVQDSPPTNKRAAAAQVLLVECSDFFER